MKFLTTSMVAAGLLVLAACESTSNSETGTGPVRLSSRIADLFQTYKETFIPYIFVITTDGRWGNYVYCDNACTRHNARATAYAHCRDNNKGKDCRVFALGENIVWKGKVTGLVDPDTGRYDITHE